MAWWLNGSTVFVFFSVVILCDEQSLDSRRSGRVKTRPGSCSTLRKNSQGEIEDPGTFTWIVKSEPPAYLFGTIHVPYTRVWDDIPDNTKLAFRASDRVIFELDLTDPSTVTQLTNCQLLPDGTSLRDVLPQKLFNRLKRHLDYVKVTIRRWIPNQSSPGLFGDYLFNAITAKWEYRKPIWIMLMLNSLTEADIRWRRVPVLDLYLAREAQKMKKRIGAVEDVGQQCDPINNISFRKAVFALNQTLNVQERIRFENFTPPYTTKDLIEHYNCGNLNSNLFKVNSAPMPNMPNPTLAIGDRRIARKIERYFRTELIYNRNKNMASEIHRIIQKNTHETIFFAFGAGHFIGENTIIEYLKGFGYEVEQVSIAYNLRLPKKQSEENVKIQYQDFSFLSDFNENNNNNGGSGGVISDKSPRVSYVDHSKSSHTIIQNDNSNRTSRQRSKKDRTFNDLWVRIADYSSPPSLAPRTKKPAYYTSAKPKHQDLQHKSSLRINNGHPVNPQKTNLFFICVISCIVLM